MKGKILCAACGGEGSGVGWACRECGGSGWGVVCNLLELPAQHQGNEFVRVPREWAESIVAAGAGEPTSGADLEVLKHALAAQHQGEPVAWANPKSFENFKNLAHLGGLYEHEWMWANQAPGMIALYTHADTGEVERNRLRDELLEQVKGERDRMIARTLELSAQLAERDALLREAVKSIEHLLHNIKASGKRIDLGLAKEFSKETLKKISTSAEPSAMAARIKAAACANCSSHPCICSEVGAGPSAPIVMKPLDRESAQILADNFDDLVLKSSAPVERDERAAFETEFGFRSWTNPAFKPERDGWKAHAALDKPS